MPRANRSEWISERTAASATAILTPLFLRNATLPRSLTHHLSVNTASAADPRRFTPELRHRRRISPAIVAKDVTNPGTKGKVGLYETAMSP